MANCTECGGHADARVYELADEDDGDSVIGHPYCLHCAIIEQTNGDPPAAVVWKSSVGVTTDQ